MSPGIPTQVRVIATYQLTDGTKVDEEVFVKELASDDQVRFDRERRFTPYPEYKPTGEESFLLLFKKQ